MSGVSDGFRYGSKKTAFSANHPEWKFCEGTHPGYEKIRSDPRLLDKTDNELLAAEAALNKQLSRVRMTRLLLLKGHARKDQVATTEELVRPDMDPETVLAGIRDVVANMKK